MLRQPGVQGLSAHGALSGPEPGTQASWVPLPSHHALPGLFLHGFLQCTAPWSFVTHLHSIRSRRPHPRGRNPVNLRAPRKNRTLRTELRPSIILISCEKGNVVTTLAKPSFSCAQDAHTAVDLPVSSAWRAGACTLGSRMKPLSNLSKAHD